MQFINESNREVRVRLGSGFMVKPGATVEIEDGYAQPRRADNGSRRPSVIEQLAPQLKPADPTERAQWERVPDATPRAGKAAGMPTVDGLVAAGVPKGQAELIVRAALEAALENLNPKADAPAQAPAATEKKSK